MPNLCVQGHDRDVVGVDKYRRCKRCRRAQDVEAARRRRRRRGVAELPKDQCRNGLHPKPESGECRPCFLARKKRERDNAKARGRPRVPVKPPEIAVDGFEDEFGTCPLPGRPEAWVDRTALVRRIRGEVVGRDLTPGETRALHLLGLLRPNPGRGYEPHRAKLIFSDGKRL